MSKWLAALILPLLAALPIPLQSDTAYASPADDYEGPYFGADNFPPGCVRTMSTSDPANVCHHMRTGLNALDSPQVDVLVLVPGSPTAERDMRIMRQSIDMWEGGIDYLAAEMGLDWLADGMDFHVTVDSVDPTGGDGGEFTTYPIVDPEIVVIATNPVGGIGIGIDPGPFTESVVSFGDDGGLCHGVANPLDFEAWENLPGFNTHHESRSGTYVEDCGGAGGNVCFAINGAIDPAPELVDVFSLFDLVSHEFGHCLTLGHVGDGAEGSWGVVPTNDIMAYSQDPPDGTKCVSTLDVEGVAVRMSRYLDVDGDGSVTAGDRLLANDQIGEGGEAFQIQHPGDHLFASGTGSPFTCPQPDLGLVPGPRTDWTPTPVPSTPTDPTKPTGSYADAEDDATTPATEILDLDVAVTATHVDATIKVADIWPSTTVVSPVSYGLLIDGRRFDSFVRYPIDNNPKTWDNSAAAYLPDGTSTWNLAADTISFHIPRSYLGGAGIVAPYEVSSRTMFGVVFGLTVDDRAPERGDSIGVTG